MTDAVEIGTVSARGQIAIPSDIRNKMHLKEGEKVLFFLTGDSLMIKKVQSMSWEEITKPLVEAKKKIREEDVSDLIHEMRRKKKLQNPDSVKG